MIGQTGVALTDMQKFRTMFGLPANDPQILLMPGSANPGVTGDEGEADIDIQWSGAIAPSAISASP